jgi:GNAT superfamily N-acetyltransferase
MPKVAVRVVAERSDSGAISRELWKGLVRFNREQAGPLRYRRTVLSVRDGKGRLLGGLILQSYWRESYVELLWLSARARKAGFGSQLVKEAERRARRRGSRLIHLNTYSFQAPGFYEKNGYRRFGEMSGSPQGESRYFYVKRLSGRGDTV